MASIMVTERIHTTVGVDKAYSTRYTVRMNELATYLMTAMISWSPLSNHAYHEAKSITEARYAQIASEVADASFEEEPLFAGPDGRAKTAEYMLSIASYESGGFREDVQFCTLAGDGNKAFGLFQSHGNKDAICYSLRAAYHVALEQARESLRACRALPLYEQLSGYTAGDCVHGRHASKIRSGRAFRYWAEHPFVATLPTP